jgi:hypothetical protein
MLVHLGIGSEIDVEEILDEITEPYERWFVDHGYPRDCFEMLRDRWCDDLFYQVIEIYVGIRDDDIAAHFILEHATELPVIEFWNIGVTGIYRRRPPRLRY